jgi:hypothetical protein
MRTKDFVDQRRPKSDPDRLLGSRIDVRPIAMNRAASQLGDQ